MLLEVRVGRRNPPGECGPAEPSPLGRHAKLPARSSRFDKGRFCDLLATTPATPDCTDARDRPSWSVTSTPRRTPSRRSDSPTAGSRRRRARRAARTRRASCSCATTRSPDGRTVDRRGTPACRRSATALDACGDEMLVNVEIKNLASDGGFDAIDVDRRRGRSTSCVGRGERRSGRWLISSFSWATIGACRASRRRHRDGVAVHDGRRRASIERVVAAGPRRDPSVGARSSPSRSSSDATPPGCS